MFDIDAAFLETEIRTVVATASRSCGDYHECLRSHPSGEIQQQRALISPRLQRCSSFVRFRPQAFKSCGRVVVKTTMA
jgi:hypothetical protein